MCYSLDWRVHLSGGLSLQTKTDSNRCQATSKLTISYSIQRIVAARNRSIRWSVRQRVCASGRQGNQVKDLDGTRHCKRFGSNSSGRVWSAVTERMRLGRLVAAAWKPRLSGKRESGDLLKWMHCSQGGITLQKCSAHHVGLWADRLVLCGKNGRQHLRDVVARFFLQREKGKKRKERSCIWMHRKPLGATKPCRF